MENNGSKNLFSVGWVICDKSSNLRCISFVASDLSG